jgi:hypothetical protein
MATVERTRGGRAKRDGATDRAPSSRARSRLAARCALALVLGAAPLLAGCRVDQNDIHRWETTDRGPRKLCAVLIHDKYDMALRVEAALSLIRMKPRSGRRPAFSNIDPDGELEPCKKTFVEALASVSSDTRQTIVAGLVPQIINELKKPPPVAQAGQPSPPDPSFPYKDAAYAMLTAERTVVLTDEALKQNLKSALIEWAMADFEHRLDNRTQLYGMEQLLRFIGPSAVVGLPKLMTRETRRLDQMATLVAELGDPKTKEAASAALVGIAKYVASDEWMKVKKPELEAANAASKLQPTPDQFQMQLLTYQGEELLRAFGSLKKVGGRPAIDFALTFAADKGPDLGKRPEADPKVLKEASDKATKEATEKAQKDGASKEATEKAVKEATEKAEKEIKDKMLTAQALWDLRKEQIEKRRQAALAALEGRLDRSNADDIKRILDIAKSDAPDAILDLAFRRAGEMPRELVVDKLYELFKGDKWKIRRAAAATVLKMSTVKHIDEFMGKLPQDGKNFAMAEAITYGALIGDLKEGSVVDALKKHLTAGPSVARTTALSYYLTLANKTQIDDVKAAESDSTQAPTCDIEPDCRWVCEVAKEGAKDPKEREQKDIKTVGDFVKFCVEPAMLDRAPEAKKDEPKKDEPKKDAPKQDEPKKDEKK